MSYIKTARGVSIISSLILFFGLIFGCASVPGSQALRQVRVGMTKSDVLGLVGDPTRTDRRHGQDRWAYEVSDNESDAITYIFFSEGRVTYIGDAKAPGADAAGEAADSVPKAISPATPDTTPKKPEGEGFHPVDNGN